MVRVLLPHLILPSFIWYGRIYSLGIEPWTSYPCVGLQKVIERGTAMKLEPGQSLEAWLSAVAFVGMEDIHSIT